MGTISVEKMAGYCLIIGPIVAVLIYFIQPGGVLGIGGQPDPTDAEAVIKLWTGDLQTYGIVTSMLIPVALITMLSGLMYFVQSLEGGNGYALARLGMPMVFIAVAGWAIGSGLSLGAGIGTVTLTGDRELATIGFSLANLIDPNCSLINFIRDNLKNLHILLISRFLPSLNLNINQ